MKHDQEVKAFLKQLFQQSADITIDEHVLVKGEERSVVLVLFCNGLIDKKMINENLQEFQHAYADNGVNGIESVRSSIRLNLSGEKRKKEAEETLLDKVYSGYTAFIIEDVCFLSDTVNPPVRTPEESTTEVSLRGPRDAFVEDIRSNVALIRKRLKTRTLVAKQFEIGKRSKTNVQLLYLSDVVNQELIEEVTRRLEQIDIDILETDNQLLALLSDNPLALFPLLKATSRPDGVVASLAVGRCAIMLDNVPNVLIAPANLIFNLKTPEDQHIPYYYGTFELLIRFLGLFTSLFLPAFWVALTSFNVEQLPFSLVATIGSSRLGVPFNTSVEMLLVIGLFEIFREAGVRLPKAVGQTIAVVGGLIVGDAAIRAGLTSPTMLVVSAMTAVSTFTLGNQALYGTVSILRILAILLSSVLGMLGFFSSVFLVLGYLARLESFGLPYLSPISPFDKNDVMKALFKLPVVAVKERAQTLDVNDPDRKE
ncbi:spore germination protein [Alkalihalobacillus oceani]|uniref:spore germination protein n=1 Tax=Halalkalibacter oceani TaxID=1653776 RepID=UPI00203E9AE0|nr:spore germination protein [Halalkalibacter oceani]MCM3761366.1 spore germination protein [Halalkalibacter oceani]